MLLFQIIRAQSRVKCPNWLAKYNLKKVGVVPNFDNLWYNLPWQSSLSNNHKILSIPSPQ